MNDSEWKLVDAIRAMTNQYVSTKASKSLALPGAEGRSFEAREPELVELLAAMCSKYLERTDTGEVVLDNGAISAGEHAYEQLEARGLIVIDPTGYRFARWTEAGSKLIAKRAL